MKKSIWKQVASVLLAVALGLSLIFYDNIQSMFNVGVNKVLKRNGLEGYGVSSSNPLAVKVGMKVLEDGGNAADAAVAISYVLGVVEPYGSGIGGGGAMLIYSPKDNKFEFFNYRETAPISSDTQISGIGVPGFVKGMEDVNKAYGVKSMSELLQPAIDYAENGFEMDTNLYNRLNVFKGYSDMSSLSTFYDENGEPKSEGTTIVQRELADTLKSIQKDGSESFYSGTIAKNLTIGTTLTSEDLSAYKTEVLEHVTGEFNGYEIISAPAPFSGTTLIQILKMAEYANVQNYTSNETEYLEKMSQIVNIAYTNRMAHIADPNFEDVNSQKYVTDKYVKRLYERKYTEDITEDESEDTTAFVVTDKDGMMVSCTNTLGDFFGSQVTIGGFFLNDSVGHFNENSHSINAYEAGKRSRTFIAPTIIRKGEDFIMGIASPGGNVIPQAISEVLLDYLKFGKNISEAIEEPRTVFRNNTEILTEREISDDIMSNLKEDGYSISYYDSNIFYGSIQTIIKDKTKGITGGADYRRRGEYQVKY